ncbi:MAG: Crp/Fnr family transcriptional regulator [Bacteroidia bacterium]|nr:Crp/Fnr family transcriptional regulator [Bacteroidia bacterium]
MPLLSYISSLISISKELEKEIISVSKEISIPKNTILIKNGERCRNLYFIKKGLLRGFYYDEQKEITHWFAKEKEFATSFYSFITNEPSPESIETLEDCELLKIAHTDLENLYKSFPETERIGRIITETYYIDLEERFLNIQFKSAKERYQNLITKNPSLIQRASLGQIATYLGITQETLSRVRSEK